MTQLINSIKPKLADAGVVASMGIFLLYLALPALV